MTLLDLQIHIIHQCNQDKYILVQYVVLYHITGKTNYLDINNNVTDNHQAKVHYITQI